MSRVPKWKTTVTSRDATWVPTATATVTELHKVADERRPATAPIVKKPVKRQAARVLTFSERLQQKAEEADLARVLKILRGQLYQRGAMSPVFCQMADADGNGELDLGEWMTLLRRLGVREKDEVLKHAFKSLDADGSGSIDYAEFSTVLSPELRILGDQDWFKGTLSQAYLELVNGEQNQSRKAYTNKFMKGGDVAAYIATEEAEADAAENDRRAKAREEERQAQEAVAAAAAAAQKARDDKALEARRAKARHDRNERGRTRKAMEAIRAQLDAASTPSTFFKTIDIDGSGRVSLDEIEKLLQKQGILNDTALAQRVLDQLDIDGDGDITYREFITRLLNKVGDEHLPPPGADEHGVRAHVATLEMASPAVRRATLKSMQKVREHLLDTRYHESPEVAFAKMDLDGDALVTYSEFAQFVAKWMPEVKPDEAARISRMFDGNGDGSIDLTEFCNTISADDDRIESVSVGATARTFEREEMRVRRSNAKGRLGSTPIGHYGVQCDDLITSYPGSTHYADDHERHAFYRDKAGASASMAQADRQARLKLQRSKLQSLRDNARRVEEFKRDAEARVEAQAEARLDSIFKQNQRYSHSIAREQRRLLKWEQGAFGMPVGDGA